VLRSLVERAEDLFNHTNKMIQRTCHLLLRPIRVNGWHPAFEQSLILAVLVNLAVPQFVHL